MFDSDEDGLLSREELTRAARALQTIQMENADDSNTVGNGEVKGELAAEDVEESREDDSVREVTMATVALSVPALTHLSLQSDTPEEIASSALRSFSNEHVC